MYNYASLSQEQLEFIAVAEAGEIENGERLFLQIDDLDLVVFQIAGEYFAIGDVCSHDGGPVGEGEVDGLEVSCPRHGARFDLRTGKVRSLPAIVDIPAYPVRVSGGQIEVGIPLNPLN
jgi:3-phenylpropionate/trans-cinnamate dioxygenase ferredoxin subunit